MKTTEDDMIEKICDIVKTYAADDVIMDTAIPSLQIYRTSQENVKIHTVYKPSVCMTLQGSKDVILEDEIFNYSKGEFLFTSMDLPVCGRVVKASTDLPYISLVLNIDTTDIFEIQKSMPVYELKSSRRSRAIFVEKMGASLSDAVFRLVKCLDHPVDIPVLSPLIIREIIYRLLTSEYGDVVAQLGVIGGKTQKIAKAVEFINNRYTEKLDMKGVAKIAGMSTSIFFKNFKETTGMSPLTYQKKIRLQEARQLLISTTNDAATVGFMVGYESPSQFSREYSSMFGLPPKKDIQLMKKQNAFA